MHVIAEATFTDLLRNPREITALLDQGDVILHRRDAEDLRLSMATRASASVAGMEVIGRLLASAMADEVVRERMGHQASLPWLQYLPETSRQQFFVELFAGVEAAGAIGTFAPVDRLLDEWRATAAIHADPDLADRLRRPLPGDGLAVERPTTR
jgi:hypothetical protein